MRLLVATTLCLLLCSSSVFGEVMRTEINPTTGHRYHLLKPQSWDDAESEAVDLGGHLVTINDASENNWIISTFGGDTAINSHVFIGLNDVAVDRTYVWASGEPATYFNWDPALSQPNESPNEDYVYLVLVDDYAWGGAVFTQGKWHDSFPFNNYAIAEVVPEPSTFALLGFGALGLLVRFRCKRK